MASDSSASANEPAKDLNLVHTGRMVSSGISDVAFASVHSEKTHLKKLIMIIIIIIIMKNHKNFRFLLGGRNGLLVH